MVLLKNDGVLPLKTSGIKIAVVGPLADQTKVLLGNYNGIPTHTVSVPVSYTHLDVYKRQPPQYRHQRHGKYQAALNRNRGLKYQPDHNESGEHDRQNQCGHKDSRQECA